MPSVSAASPDRNAAAFRLRAALALSFALAASPGCQFVPRSKVDDCQRVAQTLRSENARLKDVSLDLRTQNQDLTQRAVDDARRLALQDEAVDRLEKSVTAYQAERDQLAGAFEALKRQVHQAVSASAGAPARPDAAAPEAPFEAFARAHEGWTHDPASRTLSAPAGHLFGTGSKALKPEAVAELRALGSALGATAKGTGDGPELEVSAAGEAPEVVRAGLTPGDETEARAARRFLGAARSDRVREAVAGASGLAPGRVRIAPPSAAVEAASRVCLRALPPHDAPAGSLDSGPSRDK